MSDVEKRRNFLLGNISHLALALIIEALPLAVHLPLRFATLPGNTKGLSMIRTTLLAGAVLLLAVSSSPAAKHRAEVLAEAAPADAISKEIAPLLQPTGIRVIRGTSRKICDIWLCKQWKVKSFKLGNDLNYPFTPGQLIGVVRFHRKGRDFRAQDIAKGVYTLRYAQQPVDGAHVGTSPTRDFVLMIQTSRDKSGAPLQFEKLTQDSAEAAGTNHPCILSLQKAGEKAPLIRNNSELDWWIVRTQSDALQGKEAKKLPLELVVVGHAPE